jgi:hypothetical protein
MWASHDFDKKVAAKSKKVAALATFFTLKGCQRMPKTHILT